MIFKECCPHFLDAVIRNCTSFPITCNGHPGHLSNAFDLSLRSSKNKITFLFEVQFPIPNFSIHSKVQVKFLNCIASKKTKQLG